MSSQSGILRVLALLLLLLCFCFGLNAQNILWVDSLTSGPRQQVEFLVNVANTDTIVAVQCDIVFPTGLSYVNNSVQLSARASGQTLSASMISSTTLRILVYSLTGAALEGKSGPAASFVGQAGVQPGTFSLHVANAVLSNPENINVLTQARDGQFILSAPSIKTSADSIDFGSIPLGQSANVTATISNVGNMPLTLQAISSTLAEIVATDSSSATINANSSITRTLRFQPVKKGVKIGVISLKSNDPQDSLKVIKVRGTAYAVNEIHVGTATARSGYQTNLGLSVNNMEPFNALQCVLHLPSVMKYVNGSAVLLSRKVDHSLSADTIGNSLNIVCFSPSNSAFQGNSGDILELTFLVTGQGGSYTIPIDGGILADSAGTNIISASYNGSLQIAAPKLQLSSQQLNFGSVSSVSNASQSLSIQNIGSDTLVIASMTVAGDGFTMNQSLPLVLALNQSRSVQVVLSSAREGTHTGSITIRSNDVTNDPAVVSLSGSIFIPNVLSVEQDSIYENQSGVIRINLWNLKPVTAVQFDLTIPTGLVASIDSLRKTSRSTNHILQASSLGSNVCRFILYSPTSAVLNDSIGGIMELPTYASGPSGSYSIQFQNVSISDTSGHNISTGPQNGTIEVVATAPPLSVELLSFIAASGNSCATLTWKTATEVSNYGFDMERRIVDSSQASITSWEKIGFVHGNGTSNAPHTYSFTDQGLSCGTYAYRLKQINGNGAFRYSQETEVTIEAPKVFALSQNYPNPFNPSTTIQYGLPVRSRVRLVIYNILGQAVKEMIYSEQPAGYQSLVWNANVASGIYFYRIETTSVDSPIRHFAETKKMLLLK